MAFEASQVLLSILNVKQGINNSKYHINYDCSGVCLQVSLRRKAPQKVYERNLHGSKGKTSFNKFYMAAAKNGKTLSICERQNENHNLFSS